MRTILKKLTIYCLILAFCIVPVIGSMNVAAYDWWIKEVSYEVTNELRETVTGPNTRIFLPEVAAVLPDGNQMDVTYEITKDQETVAQGTYESGTFFDLVGAGTYVITYTGVDASNSYSIQVIADDAYPSVILEKDVERVANTDVAFSIPNGKIAYQGEETTAYVTVQMANNNRYKAVDKVIPESGLMYLEYSANLGGKSHKFTYEVEVLDAEEGFIDEAGNFYPSATKAYEHTDLSGCILNGPTTKIYTYSKIVDLSLCTKDVPLIVLNNAAVTATTLPKFKIVDAHDPQNYIEVYGRICRDSYQVVYSVAKAPNQNYVGMSGGALYTGDIFGTPTTFPTTATAYKVPAKYYYDAEEKAVYSDYYGQLGLIADFDAEHNMYPWEGFTNGEVYIVVERQTGSDFICVESIAGHSLSKSEKDPVSPALSVNVNEDSIPVAITGVPYPLFEAYAVDIQDSKVPVSVRVFKGYDAVSGVELNVKNNSFVPYAAGYYTIVYTACDRFGNETVKKIPVVAENEADSEPISAVITGIPQSAFVGERISLPVPLTITGGSGDVSYKVTYITPAGEQYEIEDEYVTISEEGNNTIIYQFTDYIGRNVSYPFDIQGVKTTNPVIYPVVMPDFLPNGKAFIIPEVDFYTESSAEVSVTATIDGKVQEITNNSVIPNIENESGELILKYEVKSATGSSQSTYSIKVLNGNPSKRETYFYTIQGAYQIEQNEDRLSFTTAESNSSVMFINPVLASKLNISLYVDSQKNDSDRISVHLTDSLDPSISIQLDIVKIGSGSKKSDLYINGVRSNSIVGDFYGAADALQLKYNSQAQVILDALGNTAGTITRTSSGDIFNGFPSGEVYITFSSGTVGSKGFGFDVLQINNQTFYDNDMFFDTYAELQINGLMNLQAELGSTITIPSAVAGDVLSANCSVTVTVKKGKDVVVDKKPADSSFDYVLNEYGSYVVSYQYSDGVNSRSVNYTIKTMEYEPPQVAVQKGMPITAKQNERINVVLPTASDNQAQTVQITTIVMAPNSKMILVKPDDLSFVTEYTGKYTVMFYVYDECFNYQIVTHEIEVTE